MRSTRPLIAAAAFAVVGALGTSVPVLAAGAPTTKPEQLPYVIQCAGEVTVNGDIQTSSAIATPSAQPDAPEGCSAYEI